MNLFELFIKLGVDDQASGKLKDIGNRLGNGLKTAGKIGVAAVGAAAAGITALTTVAVNNYAEYEQLVGGVETLFKDSADTVMKYAENAYMTAGLSANEYMSTVTSFSASLLQSLGGDTAAAAEKADMAITDMADNANKMGTSMEMIQNAYQGFAKQNYTMLDNLKLGYGGTKEEMQRLLDHAETLPGALGRDFDISNYADIVDAIHLVQEEMGIAGTTALEAGRTISGSVGAMKSAWTNLITGLADSNADIGELVNNLVTTIVGDGTESNLGVLGNVMPAVKTALNGAAKLVGELLPAIVQEIPAIINDNLPVLAEAAISIIQSLVDGISQNQGLLVQTAFDTITYLATSIINMLPQIVALGLDLLVSLANGITNSLPTLIPTIVNVILEIVRILTNPSTLTNLLNAALTIVTELAYGLMDAIPQLVQAVSEIIVSIAEFLINPANLANILKSALEVVIALATGLVNSIPVLLSALPKLFGAIIDSFTDVDWASLGRNIIDGLLNGLANAWESLVAWFSSALDNLIGGVKSILGIRSPSRVFAGIGENMALGLEKGWDDEFSSIKKNIDKEMDFGVATVGVKQNYTHNNKSSGVNSGVDRPITIIVQSVLDGKVIGETAYNYGRQKARATGT